MQYIAAPWRAEYVKGVFKMKACIFCHAHNTDNDKEVYILYRGKQNFIILNKYPYTSGHIMIAPYAHLESFENAEKKSSDELADLIKLSLKKLKGHYRPQGFNIGMNIGQSAGAGVADHYHIHIIPRWTGDSNFMPLVGKTKVVIESLDQTYTKLQPLFKK